MKDNKPTVMKTVIETPEPLDQETLDRLEAAFDATLKETLGANAPPSQRCISYQHQTQQQVKPPE